MKRKPRPLNQTARAGVPLAVQAMEGTFTPKKIATEALQGGNVLAYVIRKSGQTLTCDFTKRRADDQVPFDTTETEAFPLTVRPFFEANSVVVARDLLGPGELTQSLCSPWQNDYREC